MKTRHIIPLALSTCLLFSGCGTMRQSATDVVLTGAGGYIGYEAGGKKAGGAAIGAGAGYVASKIVQNEVDKAINEAEQRGYDRAMNQSAKQQYWIIQRLQQGDGTTTREPRHVTIQLPETVTTDGVVLRPAAATIRTE
ncbi:hypothetical protein OH491_19145 [Termitidicoccus mucosus]|uniref:Glycine zipper domain-containing protein n=1 Tax=Termitidicoccus mucosus TaxID=1184151 RepID=A0A178IJD7_9BACT|nr:hypothetical protein AW736_09485 [Opitutaceae bacterium TSB47]